MCQDYLSYQPTLEPHEATREWFSENPLVSGGRRKASFSNAICCVVEQTKCKPRGVGELPFSSILRVLLLLRTRGSIGEEEDLSYRRWRSDRSGINVITHR